MTVTQPAIKAVLWDIDGTLIDSKHLHYRVMAWWCRVRGYELTEQENDDLHEKSMMEKWNLLNGKYSLAADFASFSFQCSEKYRHALRWDMRRRGPVEAFKRIDALKIPQACVSNGDRRVVEANLNILELGGDILFTISGEEVKNGKPHPDPYSRALQQLKIRPQECLAVEDSPIGIAAAAAAGITTVAWPMPKAKLEIYREADFIVTRLKEFPWGIVRNRTKVSGLR